MEKMVGKQHSRRGTSVRRRWPSARRPLLLIRRNASSRARKRSCYRARSTCCACAWGRSHRGRPRSRAGCVRQSRSAAGHGPDARCIISEAAHLERVNSQIQQCVQLVAVPLGRGGVGEIDDPEARLPEIPPVACARQVSIMCPWTSTKSGYPLPRCAILSLDQVAVPDSLVEDR